MFILHAIAVHIDLPEITRYLTLREGPSAGVRIRIVNRSLFYMQLQFTLTCQKFHISFYCNFLLDRRESFYGCHTIVRLQTGSCPSENWRKLKPRTNTDFYQKSKKCYVQCVV
jgi:hypothetical protein